MKTDKIPYGLKELPNGAEEERQDVRATLFTQTMHDLGHPPWIPWGAHVIMEESPSDTQGHALGFSETLKKIVNILRKEYSDHVVMVNCKIEKRTGSGHECYRHYTLLITGDLYMRQV